MVMLAIALAIAQAAQAVAPQAPITVAPQRQ
jgi:hypothetical protein